MNWTNEMQLIKTIADGMQSLHEGSYNHDMQKGSYFVECKSMQQLPQCLRYDFQTAADLYDFLQKLWGEELKSNFTKVCTVSALKNKSADTKTDDTVSPFVYEF